MNNITHIMKNKQITIGVLLGAGIGLCIGILANTIAIALTLGTGVGLIFGATLGTKVKKGDCK